MIPTTTTRPADPGHLIPRFETLAQGEYNII